MRRVWSRRATVVVVAVSLLGVVGQGSKTITAVLDVLRQVGASGVADAIRPSLEQIAQSKAPGSVWSSALWPHSGPPRDTSGLSVGR